MGANLLLVDDDPDVVATFSRWLRLEGCEVRTASNGRAALALTDGIDAIIVDARMPILDGLGFLRELRARSVHVPVAVVTGDYLIEERVLSELRALGARVVFKPLWVEDLVDLAKGMIASGHASTSSAA
jgi:DNA-binding response OmpR family regulator